MDAEAERALLHKLYEDYMDLNTRVRQLETGVDQEDPAVDTLMTLVEEEIEARCRRQFDLLSARIEAHLQSSGSELPSCASEQGPDPAQVVALAWQSAPLEQRLKFACELLHAEHSGRAALKEAMELESLCRRGRDLEQWLTGYPSLFADSITRLTAQDVPGRSAAEQLAIQTLEEARATIETYLRAIGIEWVAPDPDDALTEEHEVIGEEPASVPPGTVARLCRRGFRRQGRLYLPARVIRATLPPPEPPDKPEIQGQPEADTPPRLKEIEAEQIEPVQIKKTDASLPMVGPDRWPDWYRSLRQHCLNAPVAAVKRLIDLLEAVVEAALDTSSPKDEILISLLEPLLPLFGTRDIGGQLELPPEWEEVFIAQRAAILEWMHRVLEIEVVAPLGSAPFDAARMESVGTRRTAHSHEDGAVARVVRVGLLRKSRPLLRARVLRYDMGDGI